MVRGNNIPFANEEKIRVCFFDFGKYDNLGYNEEYNVIINLENDTYFNTTYGTFVENDLSLQTLSDSINDLTNSNPLFESINSNLELNLINDKSIKILQTLPNYKDYYDIEKFITYNDFDISELFMPLFDYVNRFDFGGGIELKEYKRYNNCVILKISTRRLWLDPSSTVGFHEFEKYDMLAAIIFE